MTDCLPRKTKPKTRKKKKRELRKKVLSTLVSQGRANGNAVDSRTVVRQTVMWWETVTSPTYLMMSRCSVPELRVCPVVSISGSGKAGCVCHTLMSRNCDIASQFL